MSGLVEPRLAGNTFNHPNEANPFGKRSRVGQQTFRRGNNRSCYRSAPVLSIGFRMSGLRTLVRGNRVLHGKSAPIVSGPSRNGDQSGE